MKYWLAVQSPRDLPDSSDWSLRFPVGLPELPVVGDLVVFYETQRPARRRQLAGRAGIVCMATVSGPPAESQNRVLVPCENARCGQLVPLLAVLGVLAEPLLNGHLRTLTPSQFHTLVKQMHLTS